MREGVRGFVSLNSSNYKSWPQHYYIVPETLGYCLKTLVQDDLIRYLNQGLVYGCINNRFQEMCTFQHG